MLNEAGMARLITEQQKKGVQARANFEVDERRLGTMGRWLRLFNTRFVAGELHPIHEGELLHKACRPGRVPEPYLTVHMVRSTAESGPLYQRSCEEVMSHWDVISCSLVRLDALGPEVIAPVGFALRIPPQNIIGAHMTDVWTPNHIGANFGGHQLQLARMKSAALLPEAILNGVTKQGLYTQMVGRDACLTDLLSPDDIAGQGQQRRNEMIVCGRSHVCFNNFNHIDQKIKTGALSQALSRINSGIKRPTSRLLARFIIVFPCGAAFARARAQPLMLREYYAKCWSQASRLRSVNPRLSIKVVRNRAPGWDWSRFGARRASDGFI